MSVEEILKSITPPPMTDAEWEEDQRHIAEMDAAAEAEIDAQGERNMKTLQEIYDMECAPDPPGEDDEEDEDEEAAA